jgi:hypothetical protein
MALREPECLGSILGFERDGTRRLFLEDQTISVHGKFPGRSPSRKVLERLDFVPRVYLSRALTCQLIELSALTAVDKVGDRQWR